MGTFSDSPGAIYPALGRLERQALVRGRVEPSAGLRQKQTFLATSFVPIALYGPRGVPRQLGVIAPVLLVVTVLCTWSEALIFLAGADRDPARDLVGALVLYVIEAVAPAGMGGTLTGPQYDLAPRTAKTRLFLHGQGP
jgi:hypothetical protein